MDWDELCDLLAGLNEQTPLVRIAQIRTETDRDALKEFTPEQRRIRSEWQQRKARKVKRDDARTFVAQVQTAFENMFGDSENAN